MTATSLAPVRLVREHPDGAPHYGAVVFEVPVEDLIATLGFHTTLPWFTPEDDATPLAAAEVAAADPDSGWRPWREHPTLRPGSDILARSLHADRVAHLARTWQPSEHAPRDLPDLTIFDGRIYIEDGCHRLLAAHARADAAVLVCINGDPTEAEVADILGLDP